MSDTSEPSNATAGVNSSPAPAAAAPPASAPFPSKGRLLGLDYGTKRTGVAVSNPDQTIASPLATWYRQDWAREERDLKSVVAEYAIAGIVVGLPIHLSGIEGEKALEAREYGAHAARVTGLPVAFWDERFSSSDAEAHLLAADLPRHKRKEIRDRLAAQILLQSFLDAPDRQRAPGAYRD